MPKQVAEHTTQLSVRVDVKDLARIERIRTRMDDLTGILPQRSDVVRKILMFGIEEYCKQQDIDLDDIAEEVKTTHATHAKNVKALPASGHPGVTRRKKMNGL